MTNNIPPLSVGRPRTIAMGRGTEWLTDGFGYFQKDTLAWIGVTIIWFVITLALAFVPLLGNLAVTILTPVFIGGMMLGCRARAQGGAFKVAHLFAGFSQNTGQLIVLGLLYLGGIIAIVILLVVLVIISFGGLAIIQQVNAGDLTALTDNLKVVLLVVLITVSLYVPLLMAFWFAPALVILRNAGAVDALKLSFTGCLLNIMPFLLYGILGLVLTIVAVIPMGLGLLVLVPMVTASMYVACQDIFPEQ